MDKFHVDWRPTLRLGHKKIDIDALEAAQERATRTAARRKKIDEHCVYTAGKGIITHMMPALT